MNSIPVAKEYEKNKELKKEDVQSLYQWIKDQPHLPNVSELEVILFLQSCYFDITQAQKTIDIYYTCRTHSPDLFGNWNPLDAKIAKDMEVMVFQPLPGDTTEGEKIIFIRFQDSDASKFNVGDQIRVFLMSIQLWLMREGTAQGHVILMDMSGITNSHIIRLNPFVIKKFFYFLQEAIPFRLKSLHFFDCMSIIDKVMLIIQPFLREGLVHIHTRDKMEELFKDVPHKYLPEDYGGEAPSVSKLHETMKETLINGTEYLTHVEKTQKVNESLRPGNVFHKFVYEIKGTAPLAKTEGIQLEYVI